MNINKSVYCYKAVITINNAKTTEDVILTPELYNLYVDVTSLLAAGGPKECEDVVVVVGVVVMVVGVVEEVDSAKATRGGSLGGATAFFRTEQSL